MAYSVVISSRQKQKIKIQSCSSGPFFSATYFYSTIISNEQRKYRNNTQVISLHLSIHNKAPMNEFPFPTLPRISMLLMGDENKTALNLTAYNFLLGQLARMLIPRAWMVHSSSRAIYCWAPPPYLPHILLLSWVSEWGRYVPTRMGNTQDKWAGIQLPEYYSQSDCGVWRERRKTVCPTATYLTCSLHSWPSMEDGWRMACQVGSRSLKCDNWFQEEQWILGSANNLANSDLCFVANIISSL